ncbi:acetyltransferase [Rhodonellum sp.]|uniref:acetyltransferase n=1 Tax=Rhodonellum sp. TaxID=2231180 RepID=UPI00271E79A1|nr:acetyltransferase [Rhodonellum sp.]MDO9551476.1 acetyltransferase [Rhodonellum sp.]
MLYIYGASGHGKVIWSILEDLGIKSDGFIDQNLSIKQFTGLSVFHTEDSLTIDNQLLIGIGDNQIRKELSERLETSYLKIIHPTAFLWKGVAIDEGTVVMANATIQIGSFIGKHCIINSACSIDHDCQIEDFVHISPNATLSGNVTVKEGAWVGAGATVIQGITIGKWAVIGAGAVVIKDVPDGATVVGNPAKVIKTNQNI